MKYTFISNNERGIKEKINVHIDYNNMWWDASYDSSFNIVGYIVDNCPDDSVICFENFTDNRVNDFITLLTRYKTITSVEGVNSFRISKKHRGRKL